MPFSTEHGEQRHLQGPAHHGVEALLPSGPVQQANDKRAAHIPAGYHHREQDGGTHWHLQRPPAAGL